MGEIDVGKNKKEEIPVKTQSDKRWYNICQYLVDDNQRYWCYLGWSRHVDSKIGRKGKTIIQWPLRRVTIAQHNQIFQRKITTRAHLKSIISKINRYEQSSGIIRLLLGRIFRIDFLYNQLIYHYGVEKEYDWNRFTRNRERKQLIKSFERKLKEKQMQVNRMNKYPSNINSTTQTHSKYNFLSYKEEKDKYEKALIKHQGAFIRSVQVIVDDEKISFNERKESLKRFKERVASFKYTICPEYRIKKVDVERLWEKQLNPFFKQVDEQVTELEHTQKNILSQCEKEIIKIKAQYIQLIKIKGHFHEKLDTLPRHKTYLILSKPTRAQKKMTHSQYEILVIPKGNSYQISYSDCNRKYKEININANEYPELINALKRVKQPGQIVETKDIEQIYEIITLEEAFPYIPPNRSYDISSKWDEIDYYFNSAREKIHQKCLYYQHLVNADAKEQEDYTNLSSKYTHEVEIIANEVILNLKQQLPLVPSIDTVPSILLRWSIDRDDAIQFVQEQVRSSGNISCIQDQYELIGLALKIMSKTITRLKAKYHPHKFINRPEIQKLVYDIHRYDIVDLELQMRLWLIEGSQLYLTCFVDNDKTQNINKKIDIQGKWEISRTFISTIIKELMTEKDSGIKLIAELYEQFECTVRHLYFKKDELHKEFDLQFKDDLFNKFKSIIRVLGLTQEKLNIELNNLQLYYVHFSEFECELRAFQHRQNKLKGQQITRFWEDSFKWIETRILTEWREEFKKWESHWLRAQADKDDYLECIPKKDSISWDEFTARLQEFIIPAMHGITATLERIESDEKSISHESYLGLINIDNIMQLKAEAIRVSIEENKKCKSYVEKEKEFRMNGNYTKEELISLHKSWHKSISQIRNTEEQFWANALDGLSRAAYFQSINIPQQSSLVPQSINIQEIAMLEELSSKLTSIESKIEKQYEEYIDKGNEACVISPDLRFNLDSKLLMIWLARSNIKALRWSGSQWYDYWQGAFQQPGITWEQWCKDYGSMLNSLERLNEELYQYGIDMHIFEGTLKKKAYDEQLKKADDLLRSQEEELRAQDELLRSQEEEIRVKQALLKKLIEENTKSQNGATKNENNTGDVDKQKMAQSRNQNSTFFGGRATCGYDANIAKTGSSGNPLNRGPLFKIKKSN